MSDKIEFVQTLRRGVSGIGNKTAQKLYERFGSLDELEKVSRSEVASIDGVGTRTLDRIGIWDEDGNPVREINRNPCPHCSEPYSRKVELGDWQVQETVDVSDAGEACVIVTGGRGRHQPFTTTVYIHG